MIIERIEREAADKAAPMKAPAPRRDMRPVWILLAAAAFGLAGVLLLSQERELTAEEIDQLAAPAAGLEQVIKERMEHLR